MYPGISRISGVSFPWISFPGVSFSCLPSTSPGIPHIHILVSRIPGFSLKVSSLVGTVTSVWMCSFLPIPRRTRWPFMATSLWSIMWTILVNQVGPIVISFLVPLVSQAVVRRLRAGAIPVAFWPWRSSLAFGSHWWSVSIGHMEVWHRILKQGYAFAATGGVVLAVMVVGAGKPKFNIKAFWGCVQDENRVVWCNSQLPGPAPTSR